MTDLKPVEDLVEAQQRVLVFILGLKKPSFRTSDVIRKSAATDADGRSVGAILGSLYKNGYLDKVQGGRDKMWKLSDLAEDYREDIRKELASLKAYWR